MSVAADVEALAPLTPAQLAAMFPVGRRPAQPLLIPLLDDATGPRQFKTLFDLAVAIATRLQGRELVLSRTMSTYPGFDTFPAFSVHALGQPGEAGGVRAALYLCTVAVQDTPAEALDAAVTQAQARLAATERLASGAERIGSAAGATAEARIQ